MNWYRSVLFGAVLGCLISVVPFLAFRPVHPDGVGQTSDLVFYLVTVLFLVVVSIFFVRHVWLRESNSSTIQLLSISMVCAICWPFFVPIAESMLPGDSRIGRSKRTVENICAIAKLMESQRLQRGVYPDFSEISEVAAIDPQIPTADGWNRPLLIECGGDSCAIVGLGERGEREFSTIADYPQGATLGFSADIVVINGVFTRWPEIVSGSSPPSCEISP